MAVGGIGEISLKAKGMEKALAFYHGILGAFWIDKTASGPICK